jgi:hypothetical protein
MWSWLTKRWGVKTILFKFREDANNLPIEPELRMRLGS